MGGDFYGYLTFTISLYAQNPSILRILPSLLSTKP